MPEPLSRFSFRSDKRDAAQSVPVYAGGQATLNGKDALLPESCLIPSAGEEGTFTVNASIMDSSALKDFVQKLGGDKVIEEKYKEISKRMDTEDSADISAFDIYFNSDKVEEEVVEEKEEESSVFDDILSQVEEFDNLTPKRERLQKFIRTPSVDIQPKKLCMDVDCNFELSLDAKFCTECGKVQVSKFCTECNYSFTSTEKFCPRCGKKR